MSEESLEVKALKGQLDATRAEVFRLRLQKDEAHEELERTRTQFWKLKNESSSGEVLAREGFVYAMKRVEAKLDAVLPRVASVTGEEEIEEDSEEALRLEGYGEALEDLQAKVMKAKRGDQGERDRALNSVLAIIAMLEEQRAAE